MARKFPSRQDQLLAFLKSQPYHKATFEQLKQFNHELTTVNGLERRGLVKVYDLKVKLLANHHLSDIVSIKLK